MLLLEDMGINYERSSEMPDHVACAPPVLIASDGTCLSQMAAICLHLGLKHGCAAPERQLADLLQAVLHAEELCRDIGCSTESGEASSEPLSEERLVRRLVVLQAPLEARQPVAPKAEVDRHFVLRVHLQSDLDAKRKPKNDSGKQIG